MPFLLVFSLATFASAFSMRSVDPMLNIMASDLNVTLQDVALLATAFTLPYAAMQLVFGPIGDAVGKVRIIRMNLVLLCLGLCVSALAPDHSSLLMIRMFSGAFAGGIIPVVLAAVGDRVPFDQRALALSRILLALVMGQLIGSTAAGFIAEWLGWRAVFWVAGGIAGLAALCAIFGITEGRQTGPVSFSNALKRYNIVMRNPLSIKVYVVVAIEGAFTFGAFPLVAPLMVTHHIGDAVEAGLVLAAFAIGGACYSLVVQFLVRTLGASHMVGIGSFSVGILLVVAAFMPSFLGVAALFCLGGFAFYMIHNILQILATELAPEARGSGVALFATAFFIGQAVGAIGLAWMAGWAGPEGAFTLAGIVMVLLALPASRLAPARKANRSQRSTSR
ncbi:MAG: MFS transporter [Xanthobacter sp.]